MTFSRNGQLTLLCPPSWEGQPWKHQVCLISALPCSCSAPNPWNHPCLILCFHSPLPYPSANDTGSTFKTKFPSHTTPSTIIVSFLELGQQTPQGAFFFSLVLPTVFSQQRSKNDPVKAFCDSSAQTPPVAPTSFPGLQGPGYAASGNCWISLLAVVQHFPHCGPAILVFLLLLQQSSSFPPQQVFFLISLGGKIFPDMLSAFPSLPADLCSFIAFSFSFFFFAL